VQLDIFGQKGPPIFSFCELKVKIKFHLVHNRLVLGVQMPHRHMLLLPFEFFSFFEKYLFVQAKILGKKSCFFNLSMSSFLYPDFKKDL
jgi:hypothetical protein